MNSDQKLIKIPKKNFLINYKRLKPKGLEILAFPCDDFGHQEPKTNPEIKEWVEEKFGMTFMLMSKVNVNGPNTSRVWQWLRIHSVLYFPGYNRAEKIPFNYAKFVVVAGKVVRYIEPTTDPYDFYNYVDKLLDSLGDDGEKNVLEERTFELD